MCEGRRLVADFVAGTDARPSLPEVAEQHLTTTTDGLWVVWAYKLARQEGDLFVPLTRGSGYPADAWATCRVRGAGRGHKAPDPKCTCGFHALSNRKLPRLPVGHPDLSVLTVALSGRVLAFEWHGGGMLWRAERQTVVRVERPTEFVSTLGVPAVGMRLPEDPEGRLAAVRPAVPRDSGPVRLTLPVSAPVVELCHDDAGWCVGTGAPEHSGTFEHSPASLVLA
jgi:hypothetical protein